MKDVKILIIEDEFPIALDLENRLKQMDYDVVGIAGKYNQALVMLSEEDYDIVLLDINLDDKKSGIDLAKIIDQKFKRPVIFITAYSDQKTFENAAEANPMAFIVKPFKDDELKRAICLSLQNYTKSTAAIPKENSMDFCNNQIFIKDKSVIRNLAIEDVLWLEAMDNYTILNTKKDRIVVGYFLKDVLEKLGPSFVRIHRSHAVAINKISSIEDNILYVGNTFLTIGQKYRNDLLERIKIL